MTPGGLSVVISTSAVFGSSGFDPEITGRRKVVPRGSTAYTVYEATGTDGFELNFNPNHLVLVQIDEIHSEIYYPTHVLHYTHDIPSRPAHDRRLDLNRDLRCPVSN